MIKFGKHSLNSRGDENKMDPNYYLKTSRIKTGHSKAVIMSILFAVITEDGEYSDHRSELCGVYQTLNEAKSALDLEYNEHKGYIQEVPIGVQVQADDRVLYSYCEKQLIRYRCVCSYYNPYYEGSLESFYARAETANPNGGDKMFIHDHSYRTL
jgi:hypothetical protein